NRGRRHARPLPASRVKARSLRLQLGVVIVSQSCDQRWWNRPTGHASKAVPSAVADGWFLFCSAPERTAAIAVSGLGKGTDFIRAVEDGFSYAPLLLVRLLAAEVIGTGLTSSLR